MEGDGGDPQLRRPYMIWMKPPAGAEERLR